MPTLAPPHAAGPTGIGAGDATAGDADAPVWTLEDLHDPELFEVVSRVPILDVHEDDEHGPVDEALLKRLARQSNDLVRGGDFPKLTLGHTLRKQTIVVVKDGKHTVHPGAHEAAQPPVVGHVTSFHVARYRGKPCLFADFHLRKGEASYAKTFPYRSVERLERRNEDGTTDPSADAIDYIALLRTPPRRNLGVLQYAREETPAGLRRICYARELPPLTAAEDDAPLPTSPPSAPVSPLPQESPMPEPTATAAPAAPDFSQLTAVLQQISAKLDALSPDAMIQAFRAALEEEAQAHVDQHPQTHAYEEVPPEEEDMTRAPYEAAEPGSGNVFVPGGGGCGHRPRDGEAAERHQYEARLREVEEVNELLVTRLNDMAFGTRRLQYEKRLAAIAGDGYALDIPELLELLTPDSPDGYEESKEREIRKSYARSAAARPSRVDVAPGTAPGGKGPGIATKDQLNKVLDYATKHRCSIPEAKAALGLV